MDFKSALIASFRVAAAATPCVRLTQDDIVRTDLNQAGNVKRLLRKLHRSGQKRSAPGSACTRCRVLKKSCDGGFPCSNCVMADGICVKHKERSVTRRSSLSSADLVVPSLEIPNCPEPPISQGLVSCFSPKADTTDPMLPSLGGMGMLLGSNADDITKIIGSCPPKLRSALDLLSRSIQPMLQKQAVKRKLLPELDDSVFESAQVVCTRHRFEPDGSTVCIFINQAASRYGENSRPDLCLWLC
eukprot:799813-Rhodomonas_salina.1